MLRKIVLLTSVPFLLFSFSVRLYAQDESEFIRPRITPQEVITLGARAQKSYDESVNKLLEIVKGKDKEHHNSVAFALNSIAGLRAASTVPALIDTLGSGIGIYNADGNIYDALVRIGKPASLECLRRLALQDERDEKGKPTSKAITMLHVIQSVEGDDVAKFMLERAIAKKQDEKRKENLTAALELLNSWITKKAEREGLQPDERQDADDTELPSRRPAKDDETKPAETQVPSTAAPAQSGFPWYFAGLVGFALGIGITVVLIRSKK